MKAWRKIIWRNTIGYTLPLDEDGIKVLLAEMGINLTNESSEGEEAARKLDDEQEEELRKAILNRLYANAAISTAVALDGSISTGLWLDFGICSRLASSLIHDLMLRDVGSGTAPDTDPKLLLHRLTWTSADVQMNRILSLMTK